jgi:hypothetical protein
MSATSSGRPHPLSCQYTLVRVQAGAVHILSLYLFRQSHQAAKVHVTYPSYSIVLMMKPSVGLTLFTSSFMIFFTMVVFPALSRPLRPLVINLANNHGVRTASKFASPCPLDGLSAVSTAFCAFDFPGSVCPSVCQAVSWVSVELDP